MERKYLYSYLQYQKANNKIAWKRLMRFPWYILLLLAISLVLFVTTLILECVLSNKIPVAVLEIATLIVICFTYFLSENYRVITSKSALQNYANSRSSINEWLKTVRIDSNDDKELLLTRLKEYISLQEAKQKRTADRRDKWLQVLVIPVILTIMTTIIANQKDVSLIISSVITIMFIFGLVYGLIVLLMTVNELPIKRRINQMQCFADDLQSTMDMEQLGWLDMSKE